MERGPHARRSGPRAVKKWLSRPDNSFTPVFPASTGSGTRSGADRELGGE
jgi:hypothetical protein